MERLGAAGILKQVNQAKRDRVYCATGVAEDPGRACPLVPMEAA